MQSCTNNDLYSGVVITSLRRSNDYPPTLKSHLSAINPQMYVS